MFLAMTLAFTALLLAAAAWDIRTQRLPNWLTMAGFGAALALRAVMGGAPLLDGIIGAGIALLIGIVLFTLGALGGGDAKLLAAVGAFTGRTELVPVLLASAAAGLVVALVVTMRRGVSLVALYSAKGLLVNALTLGRSGERKTLESPGAIRVPYGVAIAIGSLAAWYLPLRDWILA